jgi:signal transduction histidine kinase
MRNVLPHAPMHRPTLKAALFLGFGLTLGLWLFAGYSFTRRMAEVERDTAAVNSRYMRSQELLSTIRAQVLLGSVFVRDALLDPDPGTAGSYRRQLEDTYRSIDDALQQYVPVLDSAAERERIDRLRREVADFRATMLDVLGGDSTRWASEARLLLRTRVVPKRQVVIRVSDEVQALNRAAFVQQQSEITRVYQAMQNRVWVQLGLALAASLAIGLVAIRYASHLERQIRRQMTKEAETALDLQRLSSTIISAQEDERRTIARELHDEIGQVLTAIKVELSIAQRAGTAAPEGGQAIEAARSITDGALQTVRDLSHSLHPSLLDDLGLPAAVDWYLKGFGRRHNLRVELLQEAMAERLAPETEAAAFRIIQEALTNVVKHARGSRADLIVDRSDELLVIEVINKRPPANPAEGSGHGLLHMRERAEAVGGVLEAGPAPDSRWRVRAELPVGEPENAGSVG